MSFISERSYGIEIEALAPATLSSFDLANAISATGVQCRNEGYNHQVRGHWKIVTDGSISYRPGVTHGVEIVSPPLKGDAGLRQIETVCGVLSELGLSINRSCGLHVHVDARHPELSLTAWKRLCLLYAESEAVIDLLLPPSRRGTANVYCKTIANVNPAKIAAARDVSGLAIAVKPGPTNGADRHVKLNLTSFWRHGTVEFRHHSGTLDAGKITKWLYACLRMVETAVKEAAVPQAVAVETATRTIRSARVALSGKTRTVYEMLTRPQGCTTDEVLDATGWRQASVAGMAHTMGLHLRTESEWSARRNRRVKRYFGVVDANGPVPYTPPRTRASVTPQLNKLESLDSWAARLDMAEDERAFWKTRAALFASPTAAIAADRSQ